LVLEQKIVLTRYRKSYPRNLKTPSYLTFDLNFKVKPSRFVDFGPKFICNSVIEVAIKLIYKRFFIQFGSGIFL
jgi:hypothetical protein